MSVLKSIDFLYRAGIRKIRFTGGEPTLYPHLTDLISAVRDLDPGIHTAITSNGIRLGSLAPELAAAGLDSINISLDTLQPTKFRAIAGAGDLKQVLSGIEAAIQHLPLVKLNCVLMRGTNDEEAESLVRFANDLGIDIRFIEFMPNASGGPGDPRFVSGSELRKRLPWHLQPLALSPHSAARYYSDPSLRIRVGFIDPVSHPFCDACDRLRLTATGELYACLFETGAINLFELLDTGEETAGSRLQELIEAKRFGGCVAAVERGAPLPSFAGLGG